MAQETENSYNTDYEPNSNEVKFFTISIVEASEETQEGTFIDAELNIDNDATTVASLKMVYMASNLFYIHNYALA